MSLHSLTNFPCQKVVPKMAGLAIEPGPVFERPPDDEEIFLNCDVVDVCRKNIRDLKHLHRRNFPELSDNFIYASLGQNLSSFGYIVYHTGKPVAETTLQWFMREKNLCLYIATFSVVEEYRESGLGTALLEFVNTRTNSAQEIYLHVNAKNRKAVDFYVNRGFQKQEFLTDFYYNLPSSDAFLFRKVNENPDTPDEDIIDYLETTGCESAHVLDKFDEDHWEVERIVNQRVRGSHVQYEIKWLGYEETTWEDASNLNCQNLIDEFFTRRDKKEKRGGRRSKSSSRGAKIVGAERVDSRVMILVQLSNKEIVKKTPREARREYGQQYMDFLQMALSPAGM